MIETSVIETRWPPTRSQMIKDDARWQTTENLSTDLCANTDRRVDVQGVMWRHSVL